MFCRQMEQLENKGFKTIDFFCGGGGMTYGFRQAGWEGLFAIEKNAFENITSITNNNSIVCVIEDF